MSDGKKEEVIKYSVIMMYESSFLRFRRKWHCGVKLPPQRIHI